MKYEHGGDIYSYPQLVDFSANINPFGTPDEVVEAIKKAAEHVAPYPDFSCRKLRDAIAKMEGIMSEKVLCGNGAADLIYRFVGAIKPKKALLAVPCFSEYEQALKSVGCQVKYYTLDQRTFTLTEEFLEALTEELDMICLCTPNNPTGISIPNHLLEKIIKRCKEKNIAFLLDECFMEFVEEEKQFLPYKDREPYDKMFTLRAFTKMYGLAGIRLGYGFCEDGQLLEQMQLCGPPWNVSTVAQEAGIAALGLTDFPKKIRCYIEQQKEYLYTELKQMNLTVWQSDANYLFFKAEKQLKEKLIKQGFLIRDCSNYVGLQDGYYRIAVKTEEENKKLIQALKNSLS